MNAAVTLPAELTNIPASLNKINRSVYYDEKTNNFYKVTVLDPLTMFTNNDLITRQNIILTKYDPAYLALEVLAQNTKFSINSIPKYLKYQVFQQFVDIHSAQDDSKSLKPNLQKILDFLQLRIDAMLKLIQQKQYVKTGKKLELKQKSANKNTEDKRKPISLEIVELLRKEIPDMYIEELLRVRYHEIKQIKPVLLDTYVEEVNKEQHNHKDKNKKKAPSKPKPPPVVDRNQRNLLSMFSSGKKQSKSKQQK